MPHVDEESKFAKVLVTVREWLPTVKPYLAERYAFVRETPGLVWRLPEVRYTALALGVLFVFQTVFISNFQNKIRHGFFILGTAGDGKNSIKMLP